MSDVALSDDALRASLAGTRMMIAELQFDLLAALLVDAGLVKRDVMVATLHRFAETLTAYARGDLPSEYMLHNGELRCQAARVLAAVEVMCS